MTSTLCKLLRTRFQNGNSQAHRPPSKYNPRQRTSRLPTEVSIGKSGPPESIQLVAVDLTPEKTCNSLFIRYNQAHGNYAAAKRGHRLPVQLHPEEWLLPFLRGDRQRTGPQLSRHRPQARHQSAEQRPASARPQPQPV